MAVAALVNAAPSLTLSPAVPAAASLSPTSAAAGYTDLLKTKHLTERSLFPSDEPTVQARRFFCRTGYFLQIWPDGTVNASYSSTSKFGKFLNQHLFAPCFFTLILTSGYATLYAMLTMSIFI